MKQEEQGEDSNAIVAAAMSKGDAALADVQIERRK